MIVTIGLVSFVAKVFDRLVVEQRIDGFGVRCRIKFVGLLSEVRAPFSDAYRKENIQTECRQSDPSKPSIKLDGQNAEHQGHLNQGGHNAVQRIRNERLNAAHAALDVAGHAARLACQMKAQT